MKDNRTRNMLIVLITAIVLYGLSILFDRYAHIDIHPMYIFLVVLIVLMLTLIYTNEDKWYKYPLIGIGIYYIISIGLIEFNRANSYIILANKVMFAVTLIFFVVMYVRERFTNKPSEPVQPEVVEDNGN